MDRIFAIYFLRSRFVFVLISLSRAKIVQTPVLLCLISRQKSSGLSKMQNPSKDEGLSEEKSISTIRIPPAWKSVVETVEFARNADQFLNSRLLKHGELFGARILHFPVVFAASYRAVVDALKDPMDCLLKKKGYSGFPGLAIYNSDAILFQDGERHSELRKQLLSSRDLLLSDDFAISHLKTIRAIVDSMINGLKASAASVNNEEKNGQFVDVSIYPFVKKICSRIMFETLVRPNGGKDFDTYERENTRLWKGTVSTGLNLRLNLGFGMKKQSAYSAAKDALNELEKMFEDTKHEDSTSSGCPVRQPSLSKEAKVNHLLLFSSSMVVKAMAAIVTYFVKHTCEHPYILKKLFDQVCNESAEKSFPDILDQIILEIERLHPPIIGCCRHVEKSVTVRNVKIPEGNKLWCSFLTANRDPSVFESPEEFNPSRWVDSDTMHLTYGFHEHSCIGKPLSKMIVREICIGMVKAFRSWKVLSDNSVCRWLPVCRPSDGLPCRFYY